MPAPAQPNRAMNNKPPMPAPPQSAWRPFGGQQQHPSVKPAPQVQQKSPDEQRDENAKFRAWQQRQNDRPAAHAQAPPQRSPAPTPPRQNEKPHEEKPHEGHPPRGGGM